MKRDLPPLTASPAALAEVVRLTNQTMSGDVESRNVGEASNAPGTSCPTPQLAVPTGRPVAGVAPCPLSSLMARVTLPEPGARCEYHNRVAAEEYARAKAYVALIDKHRRARQARIDRGEECEKCGGRDIERQEFCGVFVCRDCEHCIFDTREGV